MRHTSATIISAYRATSIVDTPMRKIEVLEQQDGTVWLRETCFDSLRSAHVSLIDLDYPETQSLARVLINLEDQPDNSEMERGRSRPVVSAAHGDAA